ncbi:MAG: hypothetical protein QOI63_374 [Thermoplasmata archaeon]|nr:hypothetical protein [Thermoplasmata archaeon]
MRALPALLLATLLLPLAGCLHKADSGALAPVAKVAGGAPSSAMNATPAPAWTVGQSWSHKWTLVGDNLTFLVKTVVAEQADGGWTLATDNQTIAAFHGAFIFPTLGHFTPGLVETAGPARFPWYHFPLAPNATWSDTAITFDGQATSSEVRGRVASVQQTGTSTVYHVEMTTQGRLVAAYDYDTATQWFDEARFYDDQGKVQFRVEMQETGRGFKGHLYDDTGVALLNHASMVGVDPGAPTAPMVQPNPAQDFTMAADQNRLLVFLVSFAFAGAHDSELVAPDGTRHGAQAVNGVLPGFDHNDSNLFLLPGQAGTWHVTTNGAGVVAGGFVAAWGLHERAIDL